MAALKVGLSMLGPCLFGYIVGPPLYWHFMVAVSHSSDGCLPFLCDCSFRPLLTIPEGLSNASFAGFAMQQWHNQAMYQRLIANE